MKRPLDKLPLAARKNIRDNFTANVPQHAKELTAFFGTDWAIEVDELLVGAYTMDLDEGAYARRSPGDMYNEYLLSLISNLKHAATNVDLPGGEDEGRKKIAEEINSLATKHIVTIEPDHRSEDEGQVSYCGTRIDDGKLKIVFHPEKIASNVSSAGAEIVEELSTRRATPDDKISFNSRMNIIKDFDGKINAIREDAEKVFACKFDFSVDFMDIYKKLLNTDKEDRWWKVNLGNFTRQYFEALVDAGKQQGFEKDDMLQEGLQEALTEDGDGKRKVAFRVVEDGAMKKSSYCEVEIEGGVLYLQCTASSWGSNIHDVASGLMDLL